MTSSDKPWWKTLTGAPQWFTTSDALWHGWAFAAATLLVFALLLVVAPKYVVAGPMAAASMGALGQVIRLRKRGEP